MKFIKPIEVTLPWFPIKADAIMLWPFIVYRKKGHSEALRVHEKFHWNQAKKWGVIPWYITYLVLYPKYKSTDKHPLEAPAYAAQREFIRKSAEETPPVDVPRLD